MKWFATNFDEDTTELELDYDYYKFKPRNQTFYFENISNNSRLALYEKHILTQQSSGFLLDSL